MGVLRFGSTPNLSSSLLSSSFSCTTRAHSLVRFPKGQPAAGLHGRRLFAASTSTAGNVESETAPPEVQEEPPSVDFAFVSPRLLPDGSPDVHYRTACGGQKLRDIMLDCNIDLYGPYDQPLSNCSGGGTCGTCIVEVVEGKELLSPKTDKEKELLKKNPKTWRLACQTVVGKEDSRGQTGEMTWGEKPQLYAALVFKIRARHMQRTYEVSSSSEETETALLNTKSESAGN